MTASLGASATRALLIVDRSYVSFSILYLYRYDVVQGLVGAAEWF
jgi:hypothetical protein